MGEHSWPTTSIRSVRSEVLRRSVSVVHDDAPRAPGVQEGGREPPRLAALLDDLSRRDVNSALSDWKTYSSTGGTLVDTDVSLLPPNMFHMDPPHHDELRSILSRVLTPKRIADLEPQIRKYALSLIEERLAEVPSMRRRSSPS
jgi:cytochrome P450